MKFFRIISLILFLCFLQGGCAVFSLLDAPPKTWQEVHFAKTSDNWNLALYRFYPKGAVKYRNPVILCHGLGYNADFWNIDERRSLAKYLADRGFDVWTVSLRGAGKSTKGSWRAFRDLLTLRLNDLANVSFSARKLNWTIDDHIQNDVPAIVKTVKAVTGASQADWIGHSLGGMIILAHLEMTEHPEEIANVAVIGTGSVIWKPHNVSLDFIEKRKIVFDLSLLVNQRNISKFLVPFQGKIRDPLAGLFFSRKNMSPATISRLYNHVVEDVSPGVFNQFVLMLKKEYFFSHDGQINYSEGLNKIRNPILFVAGRDDNLASPESVRYGYRNVSSSDKTYLEFSTLHGTRLDYGHDDLIIGKRADIEVYPRIYNWLASRAKSK